MAGALIMTRWLPPFDQQYDTRVGDLYICQTLLWDLKFRIETFSLPETSQNWEGKASNSPKTSNIDTADFCIFFKMSKMFKDFKLG